MNRGRVKNLKKKTNNGLEIFYVYEHWRPDKSVCFYVGKGCEDRVVGQFDCGDKFQN